MDPAALAKTISFQLGTIGAMVTERFTEGIAELMVKPKHAGVLQALMLNPRVSQQELATMLHVAPSLMVGLIDHLQELGALTRERDPEDRRRQQLTLTDAGKRLFRACVTVAEDIERELLVNARREDLGFSEGLNAIAAKLGLPTSEDPYLTPGSSIG